MKILFLLIPLIFSWAQANETQRPKNWAQPLVRPGINNFYQVNNNFYRGEQPTKTGFQELQKLGVKTVVTLRTSNSDRKNLRGLPITYEHIWFKTWHPEEEDILRFLLLATDPNRTPIFVHCRHGSDRTGLMTAFYRIIVQNWTKEQAIQEMTTGGYGFHSIWKNLIRFIRNTDTDQLRQKLDALKGTAK